MFKLLSGLFNGDKSGVTLKQSFPTLIYDNIEIRDDFGLEDDAFCFCGSLKRFASCCGSRESERKPPYGLFVVENFLTPEQCQSLVEFANKAPSQRLMVIDDKRSTPDNVVKVEDDRRVTDRVIMGDRQNELNEIIYHAYKDLPPKLVGREVEWFEVPHILKYHPGGFYVIHADCENMNYEDRTWHKVMDRDLSLLVYLNDDYEGGHIRFEKFHYRLKPKAGMLVMFPSDNRYMHEAETVTRGLRYAIVSWASVKGVPKITDRRPPHILMD